MQKLWSYPAIRVGVLSVLGTATIMVVLQWTGLMEPMRPQTHMTMYQPSLTPPDLSKFEPMQVVREFAPIKTDDVELLDVEAGNEFLDDTELVLGVQVDDVARAYPINIQTGPAREIINDQVGNRAIAATW